MANIRAKCSNPACGVEGAVPEEFQGRRVKCSKCGVSFVITAPARDAVIPTAPPPAPETPIIDSPAEDIAPKPPPAFLLALQATPARIGAVMRAGVTGIQQVVNRKPKTQTEIPASVPAEALPTESPALPEPMQATREIPALRPAGEVLLGTPPHADPMQTMSDRPALQPASDPISATPILAVPIQATSDIAATPPADDSALETPTLAVPMPTSPAWLIHLKLLPAILSTKILHWIHRLQQTISDRNTPARNAKSDLPSVPSCAAPLAEIPAQTGPVKASPALLSRILIIFALIAGGLRSLLARLLPPSRPEMMMPRLPRTRRHDTRPLAEQITAGLVSAFRANRLFSYCLLIALGGHMVFAGVMWGISHLKQSKTPERRIPIAFIKPPSKELPKPKELDVPLGMPTGKRSAKVPPKGTTTKHANNMGRVMFDPLAAGPAEVAVTNDPGIQVPGANEFGKTGFATGSGDGPMTAGFKDGKVGGKVYFIRLKTGSGGWDSHSEGTRNMLKFLNQYVPCQSDNWAMETKVLKEKYLSKGEAPRFVYIYADSSFRLSAGDVAVLQDYMDNHDGFLFIDSAADPDTKDCVNRELDRVLHGVHMAPIPRSHPINTFLFKLPQPGMGSNYTGNCNYGVTSGGRLIAFYTMGDFGLYYETFGYNDHSLPDVMREYNNAQYQMSANVIEYAIARGNSDGIDSLKGANATVSDNLIKALINFGGTSGGSKPTPKIPSATDKDPGDVNVVD